MKSQAIEILDRRSNQFVQAALIVDLAPGRLNEVESVWGPYRETALDRLRESGAEEEFPEHWHWNWSDKVEDAELLGSRLVGIECEGEMQGLLLLSLVGHVARVKQDQGKPVAYVDYVESAPWNLKLLESRPRFGAIGVRLIEASLRISVEEGFHGRVGLHSLPQSEAFYRETCRMREFGKDPNTENLRYFEFSREEAQAYLEGGRP